MAEKKKKADEPNVRNVTNVSKQTVGEMREGERYHGDPNYSGNARARRTIDASFTPDSKYMKEAVEDTPATIRNAAQRNTDNLAWGEVYRTMPKGKKILGDMSGKSSNEDELAKKAKKYRQ